MTFQITARVSYRDKVDQNKDFKFEQPSKLIEFLDTKNHRDTVAISLFGDIGKIRIGHFYSLVLEDASRTVYSHDPNAPAWSRAGFRELLEKELTYEKHFKKD